MYTVCKFTDSIKVLNIMLNILQIFAQKSRTQVSKLVKQLSFREQRKVMISDINGIWLAYPQINLITRSNLTD
jgi:hypothetical protein